MVNTPPCQVGAIPCTTEGIEPFNMVNTPQCKVGAMSSCPINTPSSPLRVTSLITSQVPTSTSPHVTPVLSLSTSAPVTHPIASGSHPVISPLCPIPPDTT